jgi:hypothetical protein
MIWLARAGEFYTALILLYFASALPMYGASVEERVRQLLLAGAGLLGLILAFRLGRSSKWRRPAAVLSVLGMLWAASTLRALWAMAPAGPMLGLAAGLIATVFGAQLAVGVVLVRSRPGPPSVAAEPPNQVIRRTG